MSLEEWYRTKLEQLSTAQNESKSEILKDILYKLEHEQFEHTTSRGLLNSTIIFNCLDSENETSALAADILKICLADIDINDARVNLSELLERSLHQNPQVQAFALREIIKIIERRPENLNVFDRNLILKLIACTSTIDSQIGVPCTQILSKLLPFYLSDPNVRAKFMELEGNKDSFLQCRFYEIAVNIAKLSPENLITMEAPLQKLISAIEGDDILFQMNVLEILVSLAEQNHGLVYLEEKNVFITMSNRIKNLSDNPLNRFLLPGYMKFFGKVAFNQPKRIIEGYPNVITCLFDCLASENVDCLPTAFDTLSNLAHTSEGKILLDFNYPEQMKETFEKFQVYLRQLSSEMKNRSFNSLEEVFRLNGEPNNQIEVLTQKWCTYLTSSKTDIQFILDFCRNPFPDIKVSCLSFVKALTSYRWAHEAIKNTAGFIEYLLDRRIEFDKDAKYLKFEIIKSLAEGNYIEGSTLHLLKKYVNEGPYYVEGIVEVATEGN